MPLGFSEILVTGGAGFIGSHIVDRLLEEGVKVRVLDNLSTGEKKNLAQHWNKKNFQFIEGDVRNLELVNKAVRGVDAVIHEAALVSVTRSVENPLLSNEINVTGTLNLLKACVDTHVKRFVFASSCAVYGDTETLPNHEKLAPNPLSPYAVDKLAAENERLRTESLLRKHGANEAYIEDLLQLYKSPDIPKNTSDEDASKLLQEHIDSFKEAKAWGFVSEQAAPVSTHNAKIAPSKSGWQAEYDAAKKRGDVQKMLALKDQKK